MELFYFVLDTIFSNISFVVTSAMRKVREGEPEPQQSFSKREIRQMIEARGGNVVEDFTVSLSFYSGSFVFLDPILLLV